MGRQAILMPEDTFANAAIWFTADGYDPAQGLNGRRVAGESFLRAFFRHGVVDEFVSLAHGGQDHAAFAAMAAANGVTAPLRAVRLDAPSRLAPVETVYYPAPTPPQEFWRRAPHGAAAWAYCGITHTTATRSVLQAIYDMRSAPQMPWDALICTSRAVQMSLISLMDLAERQLSTRFPGAILPGRPLVPVIPLGVDCDAFQPDPAAGQTLRDRLGIGPADIAVSCIARMTPEEKFDPFPLFLALEAAAPALAAKGGRFHLILCGVFRDTDWPEAYAAGARALMPSVGYHHLDGGDAAERKATLSGSDIFVFPIDNLQETFGLAPVEAMAAGLPLIVSDWNGMRDTVSAEVGIRVPTEMPRGGEATYLSLRFLGGTDSYLQYLSQLSALTRIDIGALTRALVDLGTNADLRARLGAAGQERARRLYDWSVVIPQMQALWGEQRAMLAHARAAGGPLVARVDAGLLPTGPAPEVMFSGYPSPPVADRRTRRLRVVDLGQRPDLAATFALRRYGRLNRLIEDPARLADILAAHVAAGAAGAIQAEVVAATGLHPFVIARATLWLTKYHFLEDVP